MTLCSPFTDNATSTAVGHVQASNEHYPIHRTQPNHSSHSIRTAQMIHNTRPMHDSHPIHKVQPTASLQLTAMSLPHKDTHPSTNSQCPKQEYRHYYLTVTRFCLRSPQCKLSTRFSVPAVKLPSLTQ